MADPAKPAGVIDHDLLETIEAELARTLDTVAAVEAGVAASLPTPRADDCFRHATDGLAAWGTRLAELERSTARAEAELAEHESAWRDWRRRLGAISARLDRVVRPPAE